MANGAVQRLLSDAVHDRRFGESSRRLQHGWGHVDHTVDRYLPIAEHGLIGNLQANCVENVCPWSSGM
jgi:hypothetical protein